MIRNLLKVALRAFMRQRLYSFINVFGLASGLVCALFIYLWVNDEIQKDKFHEDSERIFRVISNLEFNKGEILTWTITPGPLGELINEQIPEAEAAVRTSYTGSLLFQYGDKSFMEKGLYADPDFFNLFSFPIVAGKPVADTANISSISISQKLAKKLFGNDEAIGKSIKVNNQNDYTVDAVFAEVGTESSIKFDYIVPFEVFKKNRGDGFNWGNFDHDLYIKLSDPSDYLTTEKKINTAVKQASDNEGATFILQPFTDYYLYSQYENGKPVGGRIKYVKIFTIVAVFILIIACINFMNMATAKAVTRAKEVGVRKVVGAQRKSLILQFISESMLISLVSTFIALAIVTMSLPLFNTVVNKEITLQFFNPGFIGAVLLIIIITGLLAGSYPAFFLSSYEPAQVLKGSASQNPGNSLLRRALVVFQFSLTVILIASSLVIYSQIQFIRNTNLGYNRQSVLRFSLAGNLRNQFESFRNELLQSPAITHVSRSGNSLVQIENQNGSVEWPGKPENSSIFFRTVTVDYDFLEAMGLEVIDGRSFERGRNDTSTFVISQRAVDVMGLIDPVGTRIVQWGQPGIVIGVVKDFHGRSLHEAIDPIVFMLRPEWSGNGFARFKANETKEAVAALESVYKKYVPEYPLTYSFLEDDFEKLYNNERVTGSLAIGFTVMAIIISGLGLLGLAAYTAEKRKKEISIRKTLGASVAGIVSMMSVDFIKLSAIAAILGCPIAYLLMKSFLESYAYHPDLTWTTFVVTAIAVLFVSLGTVIYQVTRAALANPIDALKNE
jgi:putative ABC transport system permease protein